jgi:hypothetical protein
MSHCDSLLALLKDGRWHSTAAILPRPLGRVKL